MTLEDLNRLYDLRTSLKDAELQREKIVKASGDKNLFASEIAMIDDRIDRMRDKIAEETAAAETFIHTITNVTIALALRLRFVHGLLWKEVAYLMGDRFTDESVCRMCCRYLKQHADEEDGIDD